MYRPRYYYDFNSPPDENGRYLLLRGPFCWAGMEITLYDNDGTDEEPSCLCIDGEIYTLGPKFMIVTPTGEFYHTPGRYPRAES